MWKWLEDTMQTQADISELESVSVVQQADMATTAVETVGTGIRTAATFVLSGFKTVLIYVIIIAVILIVLYSGSKAYVNKHL